MKNKKIISILIVTAFLLVSLTAATSARDPSELTADGIFKIKDTGTVFRDDSSKKAPFLIKGDEGTTIMGKYFDVYYPINLPRDYSQDGLKVGFIGKLSPFISVRHMINCIHYHALPIMIKEIWLLEEPEYGLLGGYIREEDSIKTCISGAKIKATLISNIGQVNSESVVYETISDEEGDYLINEVLPGEYKIDVSHEEYESQTKFSEVKANEETYVYFSLVKKVIVDVAFKIEIEEKHDIGDPILVTATLVNKGETPITLSELSLVAGSLDFKIITPNGKTLKYIGPMVDCYPPHITLKPGEETSIIVDITDEDYPFGVLEGYPSKPYDFHMPGKYEIMGQYQSFVMSCDDVTSGWTGNLKSLTHPFVVTAENLVELVIGPLGAISKVESLNPEPLYTYPILDGCIHALYEKGTDVEIQMKDSYDQNGETYVFEKWTGDIECCDNPLDVKLDNPKSLDCHYKVIETEEIHITIDTPKEDEEVSGTVKVSGSVSYVYPMPKIVAIQVSINKGPWFDAEILPHVQVVGAPLPWLYNWETTEYVNGKHSISARAVISEIDTDQNSYREDECYKIYDMVNVIVNNPKPSDMG